MVMTIMENMRYGSPFIKKGRKIVMKEFIRHLKEKGYEVTGDIAVLKGMKFKICHGYRNTAIGKQKTYWLVELV